MLALLQLEKSIIPEVRSPQGWCLEGVLGWHLLRVSANIAVSNSKYTSADYIRYQWDLIAHWLLFSKNVRGAQQTSSHIRLNNQCALLVTEKCPETEWLRMYVRMWWYELSTLLLLCMQAPANNNWTLSSKLWFQTKKTKKMTICVCERIIKYLIWYFIKINRI